MAIDIKNQSGTEGAGVDTCRPRFGVVHFGLITTSNLRDDIVRASVNYKIRFGPVAATY